MDKSFLLQRSKNTDLLPLGLKDESGVREVFIFYFFYFSISCLVMDMEHSILPLVEFTAIVFFQALATMSCFFPLRI